VISSDVFILTETSEGNGTRYLLDRLRRARLAALHPGDTSGDRGVAIASRVPMVDTRSAFGNVTIPGRVVAAMLETEPAIGIVGVYVPNRDRSAAKTERKQAFITSLLAAVDGLPAERRDTLVIVATTTSSVAPTDPYTRASYRSSSVFSKGLRRMGSSTPTSTGPPPSRRTAG
jgi:exonuclease III